MFISLINYLTITIHYSWDYWKLGNNFELTSKTLMYFDYMLSLCFIFDLTNNILEMLTSISCKILLDNLHLISMHLAIYMRMTNCEREEVYNVYFVFFLNSIIKKIKLLKMYPTLMFSLKKRVQTLKYLKNTLKLSKRVQKYLYH